jgi:hypothetical protein
MTIRALMLVLVAMSVVLSAPQMNPSGASLRGSEVWRHAQDAKGGLRLLEHVAVLVVSRHLSHPTNSNLYRTDVVRFPGRLWGWEDRRPGKFGYTLQVFDRGLHHFSSMLDGMPGPGTSNWSSGLETNFLNAEAPLEMAFLLGAPTLHVKPAESLVAWQGGSPIHIKVSADGFSSVEYTLDSHSFLPIAFTAVPVIPDLRTGRPIDGPPFHYTFSDYSAVSGIQMPAHLTDDNYEMDLSFVVDPVVSDDLFASAPTDIRDGDAWRRWLRR